MVYKMYRVYIGLSKQNMVYKMYRVYIGSSKQIMVYKMYRVYIGSSKQRKILRTRFRQQVSNSFAWAEWLGCYK